MIKERCLSAPLPNHPQHSMTIGTDKIVYTFSQSSPDASSVGRNANVEEIDID